MSGMFASLDGWCARGTYPRISSKGDFFVDAFGQEFQVYCARGSQNAHSFVDSHNRVAGTVLRIG